MTQTKRVLEYIEKHGSITQLEATEQLGILRLAARIHDLTKAGVSIGSSLETGTNRFGEPVRYARYWLD